MALPKTHTRAAVALLSALMLLTGVSEAEDAEAETATVAQEKSGWISGRFDMGIDARHTDYDSDVELEQYLLLDINPPKLEKLSIRGALWTIEDVDGREHPTSTLRGLNDASSGSVRARLLYFYVQAEDFWGDSTLRIGRQRILESPIFNRVDGIYFKKRTANWDGYAFAGARASVYDDVHNDHVLGGGLTYRGLPKTRVALDLFYGEERRDDEVRPGLAALLLGTGFPRRVKRQIDDRQISLSVSHQVTPKNHLFGRYTWHGGSSDELEVSATGVFSQGDVVYDLSYRKRLNLLADRTGNTTGFYRVLGGLDEYDDIQGALHIPLGERYAASFELQWHDTRNGGGQANRDYKRFALLLSGTDLGPGLDAEIALEHWDVSEGSSTFAVTGEVAKEWERLDVVLGADYERYQDRLRIYRGTPLGISYILNFINPSLFPRYNPLVQFFDVRAVDYHENIYSFYLRAGYELGTKRSVWAEVSYEEDDGPDSPYWRLQAEYSIRF